MASLANLEELETYMPGATLDADQAQQLLDIASASIRKEAGGRAIAFVEDDTLTLDVEGCDLVVWLPQVPVAEVTSITVDGALVPASSYRVDLETGEVRFASEIRSWGTPTDFRPRATIVYSHSYDPVPDDLKGVCLAMARRGIVLPDAGGIIEETVGPDTIRYAPDLAGRMLESERRQVRRYRIPVVA